MVDFRKLVDEERTAAEVAARDSAQRAQDARTADYQKWQADLGPIHTVASPLLQKAKEDLKQEHIDLELTRERDGQNVGLGFLARGAKTGRRIKLLRALDEVVAVSATHEKMTNFSFQTSETELWRKPLAEFSEEDVIDLLRRAVRESI